MTKPPDVIKAAWKSPKTTLMAILMAVSALLTACVAEFDGKEETVANWGAVIPQVIAAIGLFFARDSDKSSQDVGVR